MQRNRTVIVLDELKLMHERGSSTHYLTTKNCNHINVISVTKPLGCVKRSLILAAEQYGTFSSECPIKAMDCIQA